MMVDVNALIKDVRAAANEVGDGSSQTEFENRLSRAEEECRAENALHTLPLKIQLAILKRQERVFLFHCEEKPALHSVNGMVYGILEQAGLKPQILLMRPYAPDLFGMFITNFRV